MKNVLVLMPVEARHKAKLEAAGAGCRFTYCKPEEVADLALYLASEKSSHITGSLVTMDGGQAALGR